MKFPEIENRIIGYWKLKIGYIATTVLPDIHCSIHIHFRRRAQYSNSRKKADTQREGDWKRVHCSETNRVFMHF